MSSYLADCATCGGPVRDSRAGRCRWCGSARPTPDQINVYTPIEIGFSTYQPATWPAVLVR